MNFFLSFKNRKKIEFFLKNKIQVFQSVLFFGEESIGKTTSAIYLAKNLLCLKKENTFNCLCESCLEFEKKCHPDFLIVSPIDGIIAIETIRNLINFLSFKPRISKLKILIIDDAEKMTKEAQNALLKTLEEPYPNNFIILVSSYPEKLLPTICSRLMKIKFLPATQEEIKDYLINTLSVNSEKAEEIASNSDGKIGEAIRMLDPNYLKTKKDIEEKLKKLITGNEIEKIFIIDQLSERGLIPFYIKEWLREIRKRKEILDERKRLLLLSKLFKGYLILNSQNINQRLLLNNIFLNL